MRHMAPRRTQRPDPPPFETDDVRTVLAGTVAWVVALVVLLILRVFEVTDVRDWWLVMCACGAGLGVLGVRYCRRRQAAITRDAASRT